MDIRNYRDDYTWSRECEYLSTVAEACLDTEQAEQHPKMASFNHDRACFIKYCELQQSLATKHGRHEVVEYIGHILDDLRGAKEGDSA